jgi:protein TonB
MENLNYRNATMLDMIFENRNKAYGAYVLRQDQNKHLLMAMLFMLGSAAMAYGGYNIIKHFKPFQAYTPPIIVSDTLIDIVVNVEPVKKVEPPKQKIEPPAPKPTVKSTEYNVTNTKPVEDSIIPNKQLLAMNVAIGAVTNLGPDTSSKGVEGGTGTATVFEVKKPETASSFVLHPEVMPQFPGGEAALFAFLGKNTVYPSRPKEMDIQGKVTVRFVVNEDGSISDATVIKGVYSDLDKEALRVVKLLPKFTPGKQAGHNVKVPYILPFQFRIN